MVRGKIIQWLLKAAGLTSLTLGLLGIVLPLLPTTPFLLLSAYCFSKSSYKLHRWLLTNKIFGEYLRNYKANRGIPRRVKIYILSMLWVTILSSAIFATDMLWLRCLLILIAVSVTIHVVRIKTSK
ncbi:MAG: YbaN family protein [Rikenellaceae bacterium]|nr:YbaN family protein [Rikenellaceae bacterium]